MPKDQQDQLIASTLQEAEQHRETFQNLARDNEALRGDLEEREARLVEGEQAAESREAQQRETGTAQEAKATELSDRETAVKAWEDQLKADSASFETEHDKAIRLLKSRELAVSEAETQLEAQRTTFENHKRETEGAFAEREAVVKDGEDKLTAGQEQLRRDSIALEEDKATYKDKIKQEVLANIE